MCKVQMLRALLKQRLSAAAEEIFGLFERTIAEYEEELCRSQEENERQRRLLDAVLSPQLRLHRAVLPADVQQPAGAEEQVPCERQDPPEPPHIKEEQEEVWTSRQGEQLQGPEEAHITEFPLTPVPVKSEDDEEEAQSSQLHHRHTEHMETEADGEDCGGPGPDRNPHPRGPLEAEDQTEDSSETETEDSEDWEETREAQSGSKSHNNKGSCRKRLIGDKLLSCSECGKIFANKTNLKIHMNIHTREKSFSCLVCGKIFAQGGNLREHMSVHREEKPYSCSVCEQRFSTLTRLRTHQRACRLPPRLQQRQTDKHMETEADGEDCGGPGPDRNPHPRGSLEAEDQTENSSEDSVEDWEETREPQSGSKSLKNTKVRRRYTGKKPFVCSECGRRFKQNSNLKVHMRIHTGEKPFVCSICSKRFDQKANLIRHMICHTRDKLFSCLLCQKSYSRYECLQLHMRTHTGEKPFNCSACHRRFAWVSQFKRHKCVSESSRLQEVWTSQEGEQRREEKPEPARKSDPERQLEADAEDKTGDGEESREPPAGLNTDQAPLSCSVCGKISSTKADLKRHVRVHTGEKPFSCSLCGKRFAHAGNVRQHMVIHTGEKRFSCSVCDRRFTWHLQLKKHKCAGKSL
ncbi:zinc finger protein ZFP2-like [Pempheris klunzingeri]|uniref:zinc finger protein ZFP2-like n=1 Tax=Pempheris klunzingeri TaxID=3127111 RepID=UPI00397FE312